MSREVFYKQYHLHQYEMYQAKDVTDLINRHRHLVFGDVTNYARRLLEERQYLNAEITVESWESLASRSRVYEARLIDYGKPGPVDAKGHVESEIAKLADHYDALATLCQNEIRAGMLKEAASTMREILTRTAP